MPARGASGVLPAELGGGAKFEAYVRGDYDCGAARAAL
jgi:hypothetical protein